MTAVLERTRERLTELREQAGDVPDGDRHDARDERAARVRRYLIRGGIVAALYVAWLVLDNTFSRGMPLGVLVVGVVMGSLYSLGALGIVLIYRANRIVNFAQAELGSVAATLAILFVLRISMPYLLAVAAGFAIAALMGAAINVLVIRRFREAPRLIAAVATIGLNQILLGMALLLPILWAGESAGGTESVFTVPFDFRFTIFPVIFSADHVVAMIVVPSVMLGLAAFLRYTDYGIAIRAASENGDRAALVGIPVGRLATIVWAIAALLSALAVILRVPILGFTSFSSVSGGGNILLLFIFAAAVLGRMENMPRTVVAAIGIGVFEQAATWIWPRSTLVLAMMFGVILVGLLLQRDAFNRAAETGISTWKAIKEVRPIPSELRRVPEVRLAFGALKLAIAAVVISLPFWASFSQAEAASLLMIYAMVALSLLILTGWAGQISLGQFALVGFGSATSGILFGTHGWDFFPALLGGTVAGALVALVIGLPALRIKGPFLAVTTLAFGVTASTYFLEERYFPWFVNESRIERPVIWNRFPLEQGWQMYLLALAGLILTYWIVKNLRYSRTGRALIAIRDNELAGESVSLNATRMKLTAFVISGAIAGFAGALYMVSQHGISPGAFGPEVSIRLFSMVVIGGLGSIPGALMGATYVRGVEFFLPPQWELIASGIGILLLLMFVPEGLGGLAYAVRDRFLRKVADRRGIVVPSLVADKRVVGEIESGVSMDESQLATGERPEEGAPPPVPEPEEREPEEPPVPVAVGGTDGNGRGSSREPRPPQGAEPVPPGPNGERGTPAPAPGRARRRNRPLTAPGRK